MKVSVPFTAVFSKRRKIGALRNKRCDDYDTEDPVSLLIEEEDKFCLIPRGHAASLLQRLTETFTLGSKADFLHTHLQVVVGSSSQADHLMRNSAMDDSIGGS